MNKAIRWVFLLLLVFELALLIAGFIPSHIAAILVVITEGTALLLFLLTVVPITIQIVKQVKTGMRVTLAIQSEFKNILPKPVLKMVKLEIGLWTSFVRGISNKKDIPEGSIAIKYGRELQTMCIIVVCLTPVEIGAIELLSWYFGVPFGVHLAIWILTAYAVLWFIGLILSIRVYPHYVNQNELVLRYCWYHVIRINTSSIDKVVLEKRECVKNKTIEYGDDLIALNDMRQTNISLYFKQPYKPIINDEPTATEITRFSFSAETPQAALKDIQETLSQN